MSQGGYLALAISLIVILVGLFLFLLFLYRKTKAPEGCEELHPEEAICGCCQKKSCGFNLNTKQEEESNGR